MERWVRRGHWCVAFNSRLMRVTKRHEVEVKTSVSEPPPTWTGIATKSNSCPSIPAASLSCRAAAFFMFLLISWVVAVVLAFKQPDGLIGVPQYHYHQHRPAPPETRLTRSRKISLLIRCEKSAIFRQHLRVCTVTIFEKLAFST